ncbi:MAG: putative manganese transporter [Bacteroidales bacterium]|nr:putative manganese transporter [Bacteroidales bacterium]MDD2424746.1 putative manganese transporter [Bacteroidales bacterium]MDD3989313.1 putative manganese transporter [Bacteroidales bacterium]
MEIILDALKNSILITGLVMIMMLLIEYINIHSNGSTLNKLQRSPVKQVILSAILGLVPGCVGGFAVVSLYTHNMVSFGSLIAMMISSSGDEAFIMLAMIPETALILFASLLIVGVLAGIAVDKFITFRKLKISPGHFELHPDNCSIREKTVFGSSVLDNLKSISKERALIMAGIGLFIIAVVMGLLEHDHMEGGIDMHNQMADHDHHNHQMAFNIFNERWINLIFAGVSLVTLYLTAKATNHFIVEHLWNHVVKKHLKSIFLWTFGALTIIHFGIQFLDIEHWLRENIFFMILIAALIGLIPESGPHMVFITLFAGGLIPFSVLFVSSLVQDGHTALPLLAESKKSFAKAKLINLTLGIVTGLILWSFGI